MKQLGCKKIRLGVALSGAGRTLQNLLDKGYDVRYVIASSHLATGLAIAAKGKIPHSVLDFSLALAQFDLFDICRKESIDLLLLAGFVKRISVPEDFIYRVMNIHPSLLPAFGGKTFYGDHVHQAVLDRGCKVSGCTVHYVDDNYDLGPIILQKVVPILPSDTISTLKGRVFEAETLAYPEAIDLCAQGRICVQDNIATILPPYC